MIRQTILLKYPAAAQPAVAKYANSMPITEPFEAESHKWLIYNILQPK
jgi:hypothetical protein